MFAAYSLCSTPATNLAIVAAYPLHVRLLRFFRRPDWQLEKVVPPWGDRPSIYAHVAESVRTATTSLSRANIDLPDETIIAGKHGLRFAAGAMDGVLGHHGAETDNPVAGAVFRSLVALAEHATSKRAATLYSQLVERSTLEYVDVLLPRLLQEPDVQRERVHAIARWLATAAADREPVKFAIALLGVLSPGEDSELLMTLGRHEEFTLFSAVALGQSDPSPDCALWELGQHVTGWGRIHVVERLRATQNEQIKAWLLRDGCRNDIMDEYTALICAKTG